MIELLHEDCMNVMARYSDKYFELAIVDPPYGIGGGLDKRKAPNAPTSNNTLGKFFNTIRWDNEIPTKEYFNELFRVSKNQIIWGGNYFGLPPTRCLIVWDKMTYIPTMSQIEIAWTSFNQHSILKKINSNQSDRHHPAQKPVKLYRWLLHNYAKPGDKILDTHLGSGSIAIACHDMGFDLIGCEIDEDYYKAACKRFKEQTMQLKLAV